MLLIVVEKQRFNRNSEGHTNVPQEAHKRAVSPPEFSRKGNGAEP